MTPTLQNQFRHPSALYRGKPFWAWNGTLEAPELRRQIRLMRRMGLGGFFMHSRVGLNTPYLSEEWHRVTAACVDEAAKQGMEAWLYDEDRWPSGAAGGLVTRYPRYRQRRLLMDQTTDPQAVRRATGVLAVFQARVEGARALRLQRLPLRVRRAPPAGETFLVFRVQLADGEPWFNGYTYLDTLNPAAVRAFIRVTHDAYARRFRQHFGRTIPGMFTDEPFHGGTLGEVGTAANAMPWTDRLPRAFNARYGYDLIAHLPELFLDVDGVGLSRARYHYHDCITQLFVEAFARPIGRWCARHKLLFTGHVLQEQTLLTQTSTVGSCMRFYEYMQAPGMDLLTERRREYDTPKMVSSAARQFGARWRLTETYGCTGWDFSFAGHKALGDWQAALGINLRCQHLAWYTMEGQAKRDYPAGLFYQSPWWELYPKVEDYFARLHVILSHGREVRDLLVIHPVESMWTRCRTGWRSDPETQALDAMPIAIRDALLMAHLDFDYGDEDILARHGRVRAGARGPQLSVGQATYKAVLVPPLRTIRRSTLRLLQRFQAAGGRVVFAGEPASHVDALPSDAAYRLAAQCLRASLRDTDIAASVAEVCRRVSIADPAGKEIPSALYLLREDAGAYYLFVCNTGHTRAHLQTTLDDPLFVRDRRHACPHVTIRGFTDCRGQPRELDAETGKTWAVDASRHAGGLEWSTSLPALGSRLFVIPKAAAPTPRLPRRPHYTERRVRRLTPRQWPIALSEANVVVLDRPRYRLDGGAWQKADDVLRVDREVRRRLELTPRGGAMVQPWAQPPVAQPRQTAVELEYTFQVAVLPSGPLHLALEQPARWRLWVNDVELSADTDSGWWVDLSLRKIPVDAACFRNGVNVIRLAGRYDHTHPGLEMSYLLGDFGVRLTGQMPVLVAPPRQLRLGDWVPQGLPFYAGSVGYATAFTAHPKRGERLFVRVPEFRGMAVRVRINGATTDLLAWPPYEADVTDLLREGANEMILEVVGHRRNSHGPLHHREKWPAWTGPEQFTSEGKDWCDAYQLVPCGLLRPPELVMKQTN